MTQDPAVARFDTADLRLTRADITLRRVDGAGSGWFLELPAGVDGERFGLQRPLESNPSAVPAALLVLLKARLRGRPVQPVGTGLVGTGLVGTEPGGTGLVGTELGGTGLGARPVRSGVEADLVAPVGKADDDGRVRSVDVVRAQFSYLVTSLLDLDPQVRLKRAGAVDRAWSVIAQLAGGLNDFASLLATGNPQPTLEFDLEWLAQVLGAARDARLFSERLAVEVDRQPLDELGGSVRRRIGRDLEQQHRRAQIALVQALNSPRYLALLDALDELVAPRPTPTDGRPSDPPLTTFTPSTPSTPSGPSDPDPTTDVQDDVSTELTRLAARSHRRLLAALDRFSRTGDLDRLLAAVGRSRSSAEIVAVVVGRPARRYARQAAKLQAFLQDHRDVVALRAGLITLAGRAPRAAESGFGYGRLHAGLEPRAELDTAEFAARCQALADRASRWPMR